VNLGIDDELQYVKINANLTKPVVITAEELLKEFKDVLAWMYKDLRKILPHIAKHKINLDTTIPPTHHAWYRMNLNYTMMVKHDLDKLLDVR
jgi:hypothetical protein